MNTTAPQRRVVDKIAKQGACYEVLDCGHIGLAFYLTQGSPIPEHPKLRRCEDCKARALRRKKDGSPRA